MSIRRQIQYKYNRLVNAIKFLSLPAWIDSKAIRIVMVGVIVVMGSAYILKTTSSTTSGYEMHRMENQVAALEQDMQRTQIEIADYSSINNIQTRLASMNMIEATGVKYMGVKDTVVAKK